MSKSDVDVKIETYVKVIIELGVDEARAVRLALGGEPWGSPVEPVYTALDAALRQIPKGAVA